MISPNYSILKPTVFVLTSIYAKVLENGEGHKKVMWRHTKVKVSKIEGAPMVPLCLKFGAIPTIIYKVTAFWKKWHTSFFFDRPPSWKCQSNHTGAEIDEIASFRLGLTRVQPVRSKWHIQDGSQLL